MKAQMFRDKVETTHTTIFISSTFLDMKAERDMMRNHVLPMLNSVANKYGESVSLCDLRWGIDTATLDEAEATKKVLGVCLEEIDRCSQPVVVFLGNRYGWTPGPEAVGNLACDKGFYLDDYSISMTDLEIRYCIYRGSDILFYCKATQDQTPDSEKLLRLKQDITQNKNSEIYEYDADQLKVPKNDPSNLGNRIYQNLLDYLLPKWQQNSLSAEETVQKKHIQFYNEKAAQFCARKTDLDILKNKLGKESTIILQGRSGSGKSTMMGRLAEDLRDSGYHIIPIECGLTENSSTAYDVTHMITEAMIRFFNVKMMNASEYTDMPMICLEKSILMSLLAAAEERKEHIAILVDAAENLVDIEKTDELPFFFKKQFKYVRLIISCSSDINTESLVSYHLQPLTYDDKTMVVKSMLDYYGKELNQAVIDSMIFNPMSVNPLYLNMMMQMLFMTEIENYDNIIDEQKKTISEIPADIDLLSVRLLKNIGRKINPILTENIGKLLAGSRYGLRDIDLENILGAGWNYIDFVLLLNHSRELFSKRSDGRYDFAHKSFRNGLKKTYDLTESRKSVLNAICCADENDPIRKSEYVYHVINADEKLMFADFLRKESANEKINTLAVKSLYHVCLEDKGKWITGYLEQINNADDMLCAFRFLINGLLPEFNDTMIESDTILRISDHMIRKLSDIRYKDVFNKYQSTMSSLFYKGAAAASEMHDKTRTVAYALLYFECGKALYNNGSINDKERFDTYYNSLVFLKTYGHMSDVREDFFRIADEGLKNGAFDNGPAEWKGCYWGCIGEVYGRLKDYKKQREVYYHDLELRQKAYDDNPTDAYQRLLAGAFANVAFSCMVDKNYGDAISFYQKNLEITENNELVDEIENINVYHNIANCYYYYARDTKQYLTCFLQSLDYKEKQTISELHLLRKKQAPVNRYQEPLTNYINHMRLLFEADEDNATFYLLRAKQFEEHIKRIIKENTDDILPLPPSFAYFGDTYRGLPHGKGKLTTPDGYTYEGQFINGHKEGQGILTWDKGSSFYKGLWHNDLRDIFGETKTENSFGYIGEWSDGKINGYGRKETNGTVSYGFWKMGSFQKKVSKLTVLSVIRKHERKINKLLKRGTTDETIPTKTDCYK